MNETEEAAKNILSLFMKLTFEQALIISDLVEISKEMAAALSNHNIKVGKGEIFDRAVQSFERFQETRNLKNKIHAEMERLEIGKEGR
jgi:hypothetical protein